MLRKTAHCSSLILLAVVCGSAELNKMQKMLKLEEKMAAFNTDLKIGRICKISLDGCYSVSAF